MKKIRVGINNEEYYLQEQGDLYFLNASAVGSWNTSKGNLAGEHYMIECKNIVNDELYSRTNYDEPILFAVKYLGNNVFEEMLTGEKLLSNTIGALAELDEDVILDYDDLDGNLVECCDISCDESAADNFYAYLDRKYLNKRTESTSLENYKDLLDTQRMMKEYPLTIIKTDALYIINEKSKELYLEYSDEEKIELINQLKAAALKQIFSANATIDRELNKEMKKDERFAYLENQLLEFENGKQVKKLIR